MQNYRDILNATGRRSVLPADIRTEKRAGERVLTRNDRPAWVVGEAALATQPATSQEGEKLKDSPNLMLPSLNFGAVTPTLPTLREVIEASLAKRSVAAMDPPYTAAFNAALDMVARDVAPFLAATPTPPTLSEDLREVLEPFVKVAKHMGERQDIHVIGWNGDNVTYADFRRLAALARAQGQAS